MPRKSSGRGSQVKGNNIRAGTAAPSARKGKDTNRWDVAGEAKRMAEKQMDKAEPFVQTYTKGAPESFPTIYGVDLKEKRRQELLTKLSSPGTAADPSLKDVLGNRQVMLDDKTVDWLIKEQDRIYMLERDLIFEANGKKQGLFDNPAGLEYLHKINPGYFKRRRKMAKWLVKTQLKLFDIAMDGVQNEQDFDFMLMIQSLSPDQRKLIDQPAHLLSSIEQKAGGVYQEGAFRRLMLPNYDPAMPVGTDRQDVPFAGFMNTKWSPTAMSGGLAPAQGLYRIGDLNFSNVLAKVNGPSAGTVRNWMGTGTGLAILAPPELRGV